MRDPFKQIYFNVLFAKIKQHGFIWVLRKTIIRCLKEMIWFCLLPFAVCLHMLGFRRLLIRVEHIGHLAAEFDTFIKEKQLGLHVKKYRHFVLAPKKMTANLHMLGYWKRYFFIISNTLACGFLSLLTRHFFMRYDLSRYISSFFGTQDIYRINKLWGARPPTLNLTKEDEEWGATQFKKIGIEKNRWFVCVHVREGGFLPHNELIQTHRNASIKNMKPAIEEIIRRGGIVVRVGDPTMKALSPMQGVIDYAHHPLKSERLDIILCAKAKFFLGCTSGLFFVSMVFGVPIAHVNMVPMQALGVRAQDVSIPKLLWSDTQKRYLSFNEILSSAIGSFYFTHQYNEKSISLHENNEEDILAITCEMLDRLEGSFIENDIDKQLQNDYMALFKHGHYSYGSASKICVTFLRKYKNLLYGTP